VTQSNTNHKPSLLLFYFIPSSDDGLCTLSQANYYGSLVFANLFNSTTAKRGATVCSSSQFHNSKEGCYCLFFKSNPSFLCTTTSTCSSALLILLSNLELGTHFLESGDDGIQLQGISASLRRSECLAQFPSLPSSRDVQAGCCTRKKCLVFDYWWSLFRDVQGP